MIQEADDQRIQRLQERLGIPRKVDVVRAGMDLSWRCMMPLWRGGGRELFYVTQDRRFVAVDVTAGTTLDTGPPNVLFHQQGV